MKLKIPQNLNCPEFIAVWELWHKHRAEIRHKLTPTCEKMLLKKLAKYPVKIAIDTVKTSIECSYRGLFPKGKKIPSGRQLDEQKQQEQAMERRKQDKQRRDYTVYLTELYQREGDKGLRAFAANHRWLLWLCKEIKEAGE